MKIILKQFAQTGPLQDTFPEISGPQFGISFSGKNTVVTGETDVVSDIEIIFTIGDQTEIFKIAFFAVISEQMASAVESGNTVNAAVGPDFQSGHSPFSSGAAEVFDFCIIRIDTQQITGGAADIKIAVSAVEHHIDGTGTGIHQIGSLTGDQRMVEILHTIGIRIIAEKVMSPGVPGRPDAAAVIQSHDVRSTAHILTETVFPGLDIKGKEFKDRIGNTVDQSAFFINGDRLDVIIGYRGTEEIVFAGFKIITEYPAAGSFLTLIFTVQTGGCAIGSALAVQLKRAVDLDLELFRYLTVFQISE